MLADGLGAPAVDQFDGVLRGQVAVAGGPEGLLHRRSQVSRAITSESDWIDPLVPIVQAHRTTFAT